MLVEISRKFNLRCGTVQRELSGVWMRCGAACGQGLRMQRSMRMHFLLSTPSLVYKSVVLAGRTKLRVSKNFFRGISFCIC